MSASDVELLASYSPEAFGEFYTRQVPAVTAYVARRTRRADVIYDLVAETFARALEHRRSFDPRKGPAVAWLFGIARHVMADAERRGQVADAARVRLNMEPVTLDPEQAGRVAERSRVDLIEAVSSLPESQRIVVLRRVLGEQEYDDPLSGRVRCSERVLRGPAPRRGSSPDPFDVLHDQLIVALGGSTSTARRGVLALALTALVLCIAAAAAAAVTLTDDDPKPRASVTPTPSPGVTPEPATPTPSPPPNQPPSAIPQPPGSRRPSPNAVPPPNTTPTPIPTPAPPTNYQVELMPDLTAGHAGWCVGVVEQGSGVRARGRRCGLAGPPGTRLIAAGGLLGRNGLMYVVVDRSVTSVHLSNGRRITTRRDPGVAPWRLAIWDVDILPGGRAPRYTLHDASGRELSARPAVAGRGSLPAHRVNAKSPPKEPCAIRAKSGSGLRATSARLLSTFRPLDVVRPSYLSCSSTVFRLGGRQYRAAMLLNARDLQALAAPLPSAPNSISARRVGPGWLVVFGGETGERKRVLRALRVTRP